VRNILSDLGKEGYITSTGKGRGAGWVKAENVTLPFSSQSLFGHW
jgi:hypothetical protein